MTNKTNFPKLVRHRNTLWVFFLALLIAGTTVGLHVYPAYQKLAADKNEIASTDATISKRTQVLASLQDAAKSPRTTQQELLLNAQIPPEPGKTELLRYLEELTPYRYVAASQKTLLKSFTLRDEGIQAARETTVGHAAANNNLPGSIAIQGVLESSKDAFLRFLTELERTDQRLFTVNQLSWRQARDARTPVASEIQFTVDMKTYYQPGAVSVPPAMSPQQNNSN